MDGHIGQLVNICWRWSCQPRDAGAGPASRATEVGQAPARHAQPGLVKAQLQAASCRHVQTVLPDLTAPCPTWLMSVAPCSTSSREATATSQARLKAARGVQAAASWVHEAASASSTSTPKEQQICKVQRVRCILCHTPTKTSVHHIAV